MPTIIFEKYQATGNDFILIDNRQKIFPNQLDLIPRLCDRKFGIGSDGLILIQEHPECDFEMVFYNPDTSQSLCGNGSRCAVKFARELGMIRDTCRFMAYDGIHEASIDEAGIVKLRMQNVQNVRSLEDGMLVDTGSPHLIRYVQDIEAVDVAGRGREIRYSDPFKKGGVNINFVEVQGDQSIFVRTYERGVENETLSCGTGVTAAAIACGLRSMASPVQIKTKGGKLEVAFNENTDQTFTDVYLIGPAQHVFSGKVDLATV
ncbi:diaminopimelate epimerase [Fulvivirga sedimenti]|uniref:Diaminopimelate epimerase n=1 Tax=Fulvivirga sedimenti TaxID=2879465 RepID=A0A9X1HPF7_9BACT|nr:diaminopimelate epimerase [Fulvivirga sedimenti]MCA6074367.1 diaminopimelate epimerase [Fulvivirga sedimenti]